MESARVSDLESFFSVDSYDDLNTLTYSVIEREKVQEAIKDLNASAAKGPNGVTAL